MDTPRVASDAGAPRRAARAVLATVVIMLGATSAHAWAGGALPGTAWSIALTVPVLGCTWLFLRDSARMPVLLPVVAVAQAGLHLLLGLRAPMEHHAHLHGAEPDAVSWQMLTAHAVSTLLTALVWSLLRQAVTAVVDWLRRRSVAVLDLVDRRTVTVPAADLDGSTWLVSAPRRGPPAVHARA